MANGGALQVAVRAAEPRSPSEIALVEAAQGGSREAFAELFRTYRHLVCSVAFAFAGNVSETEEIAQETFTKAWGRLSRLRRPERFRSWLYAITRNIARTRHGLLGSSPPVREVVGAEIASNELSPLQCAIDREEEEILRRALKQIPAGYQVPLVLFHRERQSISEISAVLGLSEVNVKQRLLRGRQLLQARVTAILEQRRPRAAGAFNLAAALPLGGTWHTGGPRTVSSERRRHRSLGGRAARAAILGGAVVGFLSVLVAVVLSRTEVREAVTRSLPANRHRLSAAPPAFRPVQRDGTSAERDLFPSAITANTPVPLHVPPDFNFDFEDGKTPEIFSQGYVASGPPRAGSLFSFVTTLCTGYAEVGNITLGDPSASTGLFAYSRSSRVSFDYWVPDDSRAWLKANFPGRVTVEARDVATNTNFVIRLTPVLEKWTHAEVDLADLKPIDEDRTPMVEGDVILNLTLLCGLSGGRPCYFDNVRVFQVRQ